MKFPVFISVLFKLVMELPSRSLGFEANPIILSFAPGALYEIHTYESHTIVESTADNPVEDYFTSISASSSRAIMSL